MASEKPAFEIITPDRHIRIYANGRVDGFFGAEHRLTIINRIPVIVAEALQEAHDAHARDAAGADL